MSINQKNSKIKKSNSFNSFGTIENIAPPCNRESEGDFLLALIQNPSVINSIRNTKYARRIFYNTIGEKVLDSILLLYEGNNLNLNNLTITLQKDSFLNESVQTYPDLFKTSKIIPIHQVKFIYENLKRLLFQRIALNMVYESFNELKVGDVGNLIKIIDMGIETLKDSQESIEEYGIESNVEKALEKINEMKKGNINAPSSGIYKLKEILPYWFDSDLIVIAGRPGMGKTIAGVVHMIKAATQGFPVAYISLEMNASSIIYRCISHYSSIPFSRIKMGDIKPEEEKIYKSSLVSIRSLPIHFYDSFKRDIKDIFAWLRVMVKEKKIKLAIIDYMQLLQDSDSGSNEYEQITNISKKLKAFQTEVNIPIIALAQLSRESEKTSHKRPEMSNIRSTGQIEQDASIIILLHREDYYALKEAQRENKPFEPNNKIEYIIEKNRDGGNGNVILDCNPAYSQIS